MPRLKPVIASALALIVLAAPLPLASNRPALWMLWAVILGLLASACLIRGAGGERTRPTPLATLWPVLAGAAILPIYAALQSLPLAGLLPAELLELPVTGTPIPATLSLAPSATALGALRLISYLIFFALVLHVSSRPARAHRLGWVLFFGIVAHAGWAMVSLTLLGDQMIWGEKMFYRGSATGTFVNRNSFATFLGMGLVLGLALATGPAQPQLSGRPGQPSVRGTLEAGFVWLCLAVLIFTLLATRSRMGVIAGAAGAFATVILTFAPRVSNRRLALWFGGSCALLLTAVALAGDGMLDRFILLGPAIETRLTLYSQVVDMIGQRPLTGYGLDAFAPAFELFHRLPLPIELVWDHAHSTYLANWAELGLIAGSVPILLGACVLIRLSHAFRSAINQPLVIAAISAIGVTALHSLVDFSLEIQANMFLFLALLGLGLAQRPAR